ncbi:MAG: pantetheine-phosphate adenylyltransferase [Bacteroidales bacterium]|nr:pantetheine-phosphate adenylyltransferase [Bacteroidales bacterium]MBN2818230.1 pantetheine-phosphate adenylyltransferase [Bacteroidales bacterium]
MESRIAIFPGSFDPFTIGHESIVRRAIPLFDKIIISIGKNTNKSDFFPLEKRMEWINTVFNGVDKVEVKSFMGLTVDFCKKIGAGYILRGVRTSSDFEYERAIGQMNRKMNTNIETVFLLTQPEHTFITSTIVRDVIRHGGDASLFLPQKIKIDIMNQ